MNDQKEIESTAEVSDSEWENEFSDPPSGATTDIGVRGDEDVISSFQPIPGMASFLGRGYDIFEGYATSDAIRKPIYAPTEDTWVEQQTIEKSFQMDGEQLAQAFAASSAEMKLIYRRPEKVGYTDLFAATTTTDNVKTALDTATNWGIGGDISGSYMGLSAKIKASFDSKVSRLATSQLVTTTSRIVYWKLDFSGYGLNAPPPIRESTHSDFHTRSVRELIAAYGTHCVESVGMGSEINLHFIADTSKFKSDIDLRASLSAAYDSADIKAGVNIDGHFDEHVSRDRNAIDVKIDTRGISDKQLGNINPLMGHSEHPMKALQQGWHNPTLVELYPNSLKPLWEVEGLMGKKMAAAYKTAVEEMAREKNKAMTDVFEGLQPLYLFNSPDGMRYRFATKAHYTGLDGQDWTNVLGGNAPTDVPGGAWLLISAEQKPGMVGLFEFALGGDHSAIRYETDLWISEINKAKDIGYEWKKTSSRPLGYVYEHPKLEDQSGGEEIEGCPVFAYYDKSFDPRKGVFYSAMKEIVWDDDRWVKGAEISVEMHESLIHAQKLIDDNWNSQDWFYHLFHKKPKANVGYMAGQQGIMFTLGVPHWYAVDTIILGPKSK